MRGAALVVACGCGRLGFEPEPQQVLYVAEADSIAAYHVDQATGALDPVRGSPFASKATSVRGIAVDPSKRFLAVAGGGAVSLASFAIDAATGALSPIADVDYTQPLESLTAHPTLPVFYAASLNPCEIVQIDLAPTGTLAQGSLGPIPAPCSPAWVSVDPLGRWAFSPGAGSTFQIDVAQLEPDGKLGAMSRSGFAGSATMASVSDPSGRYLLLGDDGASGVLGFPIDQTTGAVSSTNLPGSPVVPGWATSFFVTLDPKENLYVFDETGGAYRLTLDPATGAIAPAPPTSGPANAGAGDAGLTSVVFSASGVFAYGISFYTSSLYSYTVDDTGVLVPLTAPLALDAKGAAVTIVTR
jgi:6-phosphogluconolactonase (cycloisomerase 2 family)